MRIRPILSIAASIATFLCAGAAAQSVYIDFGHGSPSRPSSSYAAAAGIPGYWNEFPINTPGPVPLLGTLQQATQVTFWATGCDSNFQDFPSSSGDDGALLDDWYYGDCHGSTPIDLAGLDAGTYQLFLYSNAGVGGTNAVDVTLPSGGTIEGFDPIAWQSVAFAGSLVDWPFGGALLHLPNDNSAVHLDASGQSFAGMQLLSLADATPFCSGHLGGCPCGVGQALAGCPTSFDAAGIPLSGTGARHVSNDTMQLTATGVLNSGVNILFQGTTAHGIGLGVTFGDGLRCAGGSIVRIASRPSVGGVFQYPLPGDLPVSVRGGVSAAGGFRTYQLRFRNAAPYCTSDTFNTTNGVAVQWLP